jgi:hypothetical protein
LEVLGLLFDLPQQLVRDETRDAGGVTAQRGAIEVGGLG